MNVVTRRPRPKLAYLSCSFGLFGLSGLFGYMRLTRQTGLAQNVWTIECPGVSKIVFHSLLKMGDEGA